MSTYGLSSTAWQLAGPKTFRLGSRQIFNLFGSNLQNQSPTNSRIYVPPKGKRFLQADQDGAEARVLAYLCRPGKFRELFIHGIKSHSYVALNLFPDYWDGIIPASSSLLQMGIQELSTDPIWNKLSGEIKNHEKYYAIGKMVCHASNYGLTPPTFRMHVLQRSEGKIALTREESTNFINLYHGLFPEIREWHRETEFILRKTRYLRNLFGDPRYFGTHLNNDKALKEAYAFVPQSTVGTITNIAYCELQEYIETNNKEEWDLLVNKHDSILMQVPDDELNIRDGITALTNTLSKTLIGRDGVEFKMKVEVATGLNWGKYHKTENPDGMKEYKLAA